MLSAADPLALVSIEESDSEEDLPIGSRVADVQQPVDERSNDRDVDSAKEEDCTQKDSDNSPGKSTAAEDAPPPAPSAVLAPPLAPPLAPQPLAPVGAAAATRARASSDAVYAEDSSSDESDEEVEGGSIAPGTCRGAVLAALRAECSTKCAIVDFVLSSGHGTHDYEFVCKVLKVEKHKLTPAFVPSGADDSFVLTGAGQQLLLDVESVDVGGSRTGGTGAGGKGARGKGAGGKGAGGRGTSGKGAANGIETILECSCVQDATCLREHVSKGKAERFLVRWRRSGIETWEPRQKLPDEMLERFLHQARVDFNLSLAPELAAERSTGVVACRVGEGSANRLFEHLKSFWRDGALMLQGGKKRCEGYSTYIKVLETHDAEQQVRCAQCALKRAALC